ncbi:glycosyltransferase [Paenibacillus wynnii]|uniref:glycosyltransferase n=1 Tax=Paenibacillus wynnii TaxID=268407 RepID=UPI0027932328|nr:glycosyltransferase [Paenibacillus wynnii]MDQ0192095.1 glycosyltransferase involved in cell wall biosynthesis [Paenibacillus wynnii]
MAGPGIRYWNFAVELSKHTEVTLLCPNDCELEAKFNIKRINPAVLKEELSNADSVILQGVTLWQYPFIKKTKVPIIVDLYDPFMFENFEIDKDSPNVNQLHLSSLTIILDQLAAGDFFICASEKQKDLWIGMLTAINRINAKEYRVNPGFDHLISVVPFGIPEEEPIHNKQVLKGVFPGINENDKVVIWGGGIWDWLDPLTAVKAMHIISLERNDIKLFFMGIKHPNSQVPLSNKTIEAMSLADSLDLTNKCVFFNDWVEYASRQNYLLEADIGLSLHANHIETRYSFRTRILDYMWCELPIITNGGDIMSELVEKYKFGEVVPFNDENHLASTLIALLDSNGLNKYKSGFNKIKEVYKWKNCIIPLKEFCLKPIKATGSSETLKVKGVYNVFNIRLQKLYKYILKGEFKIILKKIFGNRTN